MAALDQISSVVVGYAVLVALVAAYSAYRWRERPPWLDSMAWMLEALLVLRASSPSEVTERLNADPWTSSGHLITKQVSPWQIRLGAL